MANLFLNPLTQLVTVEDSTPTVSVLWDQVAQQAVIDQATGPTIASRAYGILHTAMFDAWSAYDTGALATTTGDQFQRPIEEDTIANKQKAMSFAGYKVLTELFPTHKSTFGQLMADLGYDPAEADVNETSTPSGIGAIAAESLMALRRLDGANQGNNYDGFQSNNLEYVAINPDAHTINHLDKWAPENVPIDANPGDSDFIYLQEFLTPQWSVVQPFALATPSALRPIAPEPFLLVDGATVDLEAQTITLADSTVLTIDQSLVGTVINPAFITQTEEVIEFSANLTDEQKLIAEFWEDANGTSFPPGTWMTFGQFVSSRDNHSLDQDAKMFFALGNAVFDAGVATWQAKVFHDYARPVRVIRELGKLGLLNGGAIGTDEVTGETGFVIDAWAGEGLGTKTILADNFLTYQTPGGDPSPPFAEYTSGHSSFSAAGAEILKLFTGSDQFGGAVTFEAQTSRFEPGVTPTSDVTLGWSTFSEAADEAGISRLYGGIHFADGDINSRILGRQVGQAVWDQVNSFFIPFELTKGGQNNDDCLILKGPEGRTRSLEFSLDSSASNSISEIGFFLVQDNRGTLLDGTAVGDENYQQNALGAATTQTIFSVIGNDVLSTNPVSQFNVSADSSLGFYLIENGTREGILAGNGGRALFSFSGANPNGINLMETDVLEPDLGFILRFDEQQFDQDGNFDDIVVRAHLAEDSLAPGNTLQGNKELLDLRNTDVVQGQVQAQELKEAVYNNSFGFYAVVDDQGGIDTDNDGTADVLVEDGNYAQTAVGRALDVHELVGGAIYAPFLISNGTTEEFLRRNPNNNPRTDLVAYFAYLGANPDRVDHVRQLGHNTFGFEDLYGGGDFDYNDAIIQIDIG